MIRIDSIDRKEAMRYMAARDDTVVSEAAERYLDECEELLLKAISPKVIYKYFPIEPCSDGNGVRLTGAELVLTGKDISAHLNGCSGVFLIGATVGAGADALIRRLQVEDMAKAVIADAFAGCAVEQVCEQAENIIRSEYSGKYFTWRYSPGYGDFPLDIQKKFLDILDAPRKIGLCTSDSRLLTPIKSVTSVMGVSDESLPERARGCITCNMRESCNFRKRGLHCGF